MNNIEDIIETINIALVVAIFLLNTGHTLKAFELCMESLVLLNNHDKVPSKKQQHVKLIYRRIYETMLAAFSPIHDSKHAVTYGRKLLGIYRECGEMVKEGWLSMKLARISQSQNNYVEAKELYERAINIMRETGNKEKVATAYGNLGTVFHSLGEYIKAKQYLEKALAITMEISDKDGEAASYGNLGSVFYSLGDYVKAKEYHEKALAINMEIGDRDGEATNYGNLGNVFRYLGDYVKAKEYLEEALAMKMEIGDRDGEAAIYGNLGSVFYSLGDYVKAKEYNEKALAINMENGDRAGEATNYGNLGVVFESLGDYVKAKEYHEKALAINTEIGDRDGEAANNGNLGNVFHCLGGYVKAKEYQEKALAINMEIGDRAGEATNYVNLGRMFQCLLEFEKANEFINKALSIYIEIGDRVGKAANYNDLGTLYLFSLRKYKQSKECLEKALAIYMEIGDKAGEADVNIDLGEVFKALGNIEKSKEYYEKALALANEIDNRKLKQRTYAELGSVTEDNMAKEYLGKALELSKDSDIESENHCYWFLTLRKLSQGKCQEAFYYLLRSIEKNEALRNLNANSDEIKISLADTHVFFYQLLSELFCNHGDPDNALYVEELGRARALADLMATQYSAETHISADPQSWIGIENVMTKGSNCACLYISYHAQRVFLWVLKTSGAITFRQLAVEKDTLYKRLAQPAEDLDEFFAIMASSFRSFSILPEEVCKDRSLNNTDPAQSDSSHEERLTALQHGKVKEDPEPSLTLFHEMLINPVSDLLKEPEIIIVPHRYLYRVPFPALLDKSRKYLSEKFRIRIVPSLTTLKLIQDSPADYHSQTGALIVGDPDVGVVIYNERLNRNFVSLPGARKEAEMIGQLLGVQPLLGKEATKQAVLQRINSVSLIHFAAHGKAERGEIALSPPSSTTEIPQEDDYLLKMSDISKVQLRAKLVVLSCCHSARGQIKAEGVVGLARAFLGSGARSVLASLWALEDTATRQFMSCFYEHLLGGESASESLHKAMKWMRDEALVRDDEAAKVSDWAPFMLIGDNVTFDFKK